MTYKLHGRNTIDNLLYRGSIAGSWADDASILAKLVQKLAKKYKVSNSQLDKLGVESTKEWIKEYAEAHQT